MPAPVKLLVASSNPGKLREYQLLAAGSPLELAFIPDFASLPKFDETAPTFAENAAGKAQHYSKFSSELILADDSGLVVPALGGAPGIHSARYAGPGASDADRVRKLLLEMQGMKGEERHARFVCIAAVARSGRVVAALSDFAEGLITTEPRGTDGFGYDPIFFFEQLGRTYAETTREEKTASATVGRRSAK